MSTDLSEYKARHDAIEQRRAELLAECAEIIVSDHGISRLAITRIRVG